MSVVLSALRDRQPLPDTAEFYPPPPPGFEDSWKVDMRDRSPGSFFRSPGAAGTNGGNGKGGSGEDVWERGRSEWGADQGG